MGETKESLPVISTVLRLRWPLGGVVCLALLVAGALAGISEVVLRSRVGILLAPESLGTGQPQLDRKLVLMRNLAASRKGLDCLFLGSSQVLRGIDPVTVEGQVRSATDRNLRSFNFGLGGVSEPSAARLGPILVKKSQARLLVIGVSSYGLDEHRDAHSFYKLLTDSPWFKYHVGGLTVDGWLLEHSLAFRQYHGYLFWSELTPEKIYNFRREVASLGSNGYGSLEDAAFREIDEETAKIIREFKVSPDHLTALSALLKLGSKDLELLVVELPVNERVIRLYPHGEVDHQQALAAVEKVAAQHQVPFWRYPADRPIPDDGWSDFLHMNPVGARIYSQWLGERLGAAIRQNRFTLPPG